MRVDDTFLLNDARAIEFNGRIRESIALNDGGGS